MFENHEKSSSSFYFPLVQVDSKAGYPPKSMVMAKNPEDSESLQNALLLLSPLASGQPPWIPTEFVI